MSVPAKKKPSAKTKKGRSHDALAKKKLVKCPKCGKLTMLHRVCPACGSYKGKEVVKLKTKKSAKSKKA